MKTKFGKTIAGVALLFCAYGAGGCHGDLDIMQDNKLSASNMWKEESDATSATYGLYVYLRSALKSMNDVYLCWGELRNGLWGPGTHNTLNGVDQSQVRTSTMSSVNEYADWTALYTTVNQANLVIRHVPAMGLRRNRGPSAWGTPTSSARTASSRSHASGAMPRCRSGATNRPTRSCSSDAPPSRKC